MSTRYLGETFDIHGGGLDLQFPHHEAEIAQNHGAFGTDPARYWLHSNMLTVAGQKMAKSLGNFITLEEMFTGTHPALDQAWDPMVVRFFMLQSHYRSTIDFSNEALRAAEKGFARLMSVVKDAERFLADAARQTEPIGTHGNADGDAGSAGDAAAAAADATARSLFTRAAAGPQDDPILRAAMLVPAPGTFIPDPGDEHGAAIGEQIEACWSAMADDFHTPRTIAALFELGRRMQRPEHEDAPVETRISAARTLVTFTRDVLGLNDSAEKAGAVGTASAAADEGESALGAALELLISIRQDARSRKDFATADSIRDRLAAAGVQLEDRKDGTTGWKLT